MTGHEHGAHGHDGTSSRKKLGVVTAINAAGFLIELVGGILFGSVALLGDAIHMLLDASAYAAAFAAAYIAETVDASERWTYGFHRVEVVSALINGLLLLPMAGWIMWEAYQRFLSPVTIDIGYSLLIATAGLAVNVASVYYLRGDDAMSLNEKGAFYHLLCDAAGSLAVILGLIVIAVTGITVVDPIAAVLIAGLVVWSAGRLLLEGAGIMLQKSPVDSAELREHILSVDGVENAHDIKCWQVCSSVNVCTVHATMTVETLEAAEEVRERLDQRLKDRFNLQHVTIQVEQA